MGVRKAGKMADRYSHILGKKPKLEEETKEVKDFSSNPDIVLKRGGPKTNNFMLRGPSGSAVLIPQREFQNITFEDRYGQTKITITLPTSEAHSLMADMQGEDYE
jgi:hypothetical protein